jgi:hypothetical protein
VTLARVLLGLAAVLSCPAISGVARAAESDDVCLSAPVEGQQLHRKGELRAARERFATCAQESCPAIIVTECTRWLHRVEEAMPSIFVSVRDAAQKDLAGVEVAIDGAPRAALSSRAIELDPGAHTVSVTAPGHAATTQQVLLHDGEKNREVRFVFEPPAASPTTTAPAATAEATAPSPAPDAAPVPTGTWILGGIGIVGLAAFAALGTAGLTQRGADHCATGCSSAQGNAVDAKFLAADVSLLVGVVALGAATVIYFARPHGKQSAFAVAPFAF